MKKHEKVIKWRVMSLMVNPTIEVFEDLIESKIVAAFEYPKDVDDYKNVEIIDNLVLPKLDCYADWLKEKMADKSLSDDDKELLTDNFLFVASLTNKWLKAVDAEEDEMYALD